MPIKTQELLNDLERLESSLGHFPKANDVIRDGAYAATTYYNRFGWNWRNVEEAYEEWKRTGEPPENSKTTDWKAFHKSLEDDSSPTI